MSDQLYVNVTPFETRVAVLENNVVGEVFIGLLQTDPNSYVNVQPDWVPMLPTKTGNPKDFRMIDFLAFAGVDPASRGQ